METQTCSRFAEAIEGGLMINRGPPMESLTKYLKIDLAKKNAFSDAEWVESVGSATAFRSRLAATGARSMMPGATAVISKGEEFFVVSKAMPELSDEALLTMRR